MAALIIIAISSVVQGHLSCLYTFRSKAFSQPGTGICFVPHQIKLCEGSCNQITSFPVGIRFVITVVALVI